MLFFTKTEEILQIEQKSWTPVFKSSLTGKMYHTNTCKPLSCKSFNVIYSFYCTVFEPQRHWWEGGGGGGVLQSNVRLLTDNF